MKNKKNLLVLVGVISFCVSGCAKDPGSVAFTINDLTSVSFHTDFQNEFLHSEDPDYYISKHKNDLVNYSLSGPKNNVVEYSIKADNGESPSSVKVTLSEKEDLSDAMTFVGDSTKAPIYNLKLNTMYYYQVSATYKSTFKSEIKSFTVSESAPRNIFVEGVENVRDLGGWDIGEGKTYKQGLIYRTAQFNTGGKDNTYESAPTNLGKKILLDDLKIKTEIDLRRTMAANGVDEVNGITSSPLGSKINYVACPMLYGGKNVFTQEENKESLKLFFNTLADVNNYPIAFHCMRGTDRTGALAYVLGAIAGMSEEDLMLDYLFSNYANIGSIVREATISSQYVYDIENTDGNSYAEKTMNYLINTVGVEKSTLETIKNILVD